MTTHVEKALPEPTTEPQPHTTPSKTKGFAEVMLSPVSKLELARKYAAEEQQRRVEAACERMVVVKKAELVKQLQVETTHVETHEVQQQSGRLSSIAMRIVGAFKTTTQETTTDGGDETASPTRKLLQATRNKLNALAATSNGDDADLPATNYHLKQLGLADDKINIYAPLQEQQNEIRRRRESAIRCQEKYMQENAEYPADEGYKSGEDSDFAPNEDDEEENIDSDSDGDDDSDIEIDEEEVRGLLADQAAFVQSVATLKKHSKRSKKAKSNTLVPKNPASLVGVVFVAVLAIALAIFFAEQQSGFCRALVAQVPPAEEARIATCNIVLQVEDFFHRIVRALTFQS